jgi:hypothetical protein
MATDLKKALRELPRAFAAAIGARAAMRVLPILALKSERHPAFAYWPEQERSKHLLHIFRVYQAAINSDAYAAYNAYFAYSGVYDAAQAASSDDYYDYSASADAAEAAYSASAAYSGSAEAPSDAAEAVAAGVRACRSSDIDDYWAGAMVYDDLRFARQKAEDQDQEAFAAFLGRPLWTGGCLTPSRDCGTYLKNMPVASIQDLMSGSSGTKTVWMESRSMPSWNSPGRLCPRKDLHRVPET